MPWKLWRRAMKRARSGRPVSRKYWRAIFRAASTASDPPDMKYTRSIPAGAPSMRTSANASAGSDVKNPVWAKASLSTCSLMARRTSASLCPRQETAAPPEASR